MQAKKFQYHLIADHGQYRQPLHEAARLAELHGISYFQLREKAVSKREMLDLAQHIRPTLRHARFIVNGHLDVALACGADGVHLQAGNIPIAIVRKKFPDLLIGYSAHSREEIIEAESAGASYVFLSPVFSAISKHGTNQPLGIDTFKNWIAETSIPVFALGGLSALNLHMIADSGCSGAAGISLFIRNGEFSPSGMVI